MAVTRLVKLYIRVDLSLEGDAYRRELCRLLQEWQDSLHVEAYEVKEDSHRDISYYAEIDSHEYRDAFLEYHLSHGWNVDEMILLGLTVDSEFLEETSELISWCADGESEDSEVRIYWKRPGRGDKEPRSLDCWLIKYDGSPTNHNGEPSAVDELGEGLVYRKGLLFCSTFNPEIRHKLNRLAFKWEHFLRSRQLSHQRWDNFADFDE